MLLRGSQAKGQATNLGHTLTIRRCWSPPGETFLHFLRRWWCPFILRATATVQPATPLLLCQLLFSLSPFSNQHSLKRKPPLLEPLLFSRRAETLLKAKLASAITPTFYFSPVKRTKPPTRPLSDPSGAGFPPPCLVHRAQYLMLFSL